MNVYFTGSTRAKNKKCYFKIIEILNKLNLTILESWLIDELNGDTDKLTSQESLLKNIQLLHEADITIFDLSKPSFGVGYFIGQAIANHKKVFCIYPDSRKKSELSEIVVGSTSSLLTLKKYNLDNIEEIIRNYIADVQLDDLRKFNFIATENILKYITEGAEKERKSKSEFLRDKILKEVMK